jgi:hypothetical protein
MDMEMTFLEELWKKQCQATPKIPPMKSSENTIPPSCVIHLFQVKENSDEVLA